jgi:hypothetical protein
MVDAGSCLKSNDGIRKRRSFLVHDNQDTKNDRPLIHLGIFN